MKLNKFIANESLIGKYLISTPAMADNRFYKSVVLIASHTNKGTMGIVVNKLSAHQFLHILKSVTKDVNNEIDLSKNNINIVLGGPSNPNNLFIIHSNDYTTKDTVLINNYLSMTNQPSVVLDLANGKGPINACISIGCASWESGQLEKELLGNDWLLFDDINNSLFNYTSNNLSKIHANFLSNTGFSNVFLSKFMVDNNLN